MESSSFVQKLSLKQNPRPGQAEVLNWINDNPEFSVAAIKLPTGYGKTFTAYASYKLLRHSGRCNRALFVVPTAAQLDQLINNCRKDYDRVSLDAREAVDVGHYGIGALKRHRENTHEVYATTVQALSYPRVGDAVASMMQTGRWMVVVDEYHHYGLGKCWSEAVTRLPAAFLLAMSATPGRAEDDGVFGEPAVTVDYVDAVSDGAVKPLRGHSYVYRVDAIDKDGNVESYTTTELAGLAGGDSPEDFERLKVTRKMRWSPKYISPLVSEPLSRMREERLHSGVAQRAIIGAMCVSHAEMVCEQVRAIAPDMAVDWVGTGDDGRTPEENSKVIQRFLLDRVDDEGRRNDYIDVLVHVGMAGEGLDSVDVTEVIHLNKASFNNANKQENGRASRAKRSASGDMLIGHINFDSSSDFAEYNYAGQRIEQSMDDPFPALQEDSEDDRSDSKDESEYAELPDEPTIQLWDVRLDHIDHGGQEYQDVMAISKESVPRWADARADDPEFIAFLEAAVNNLHRRRSEAFNERSELAQWAEAVNAALGKVTGLAASRTLAGGGRQEKSLAGDIKKRINTKKKKAINGVDKTSLHSLRQHYNWLKALEAEILDIEGLPAWLA